MNRSARILRLVRERAGAACEYCGTTETDTGGPLTIDHFHPISKGGTNSRDNLVYACYACNGYKQAYWAGASAGPEIWNPRAEPRTSHLHEGDNGIIVPLTPIGVTTITILRLNRPSLVGQRSRKRNRGRIPEMLAQLAATVDEIERTYERIIGEEERRAELLSLIRDLHRQIGELAGE